MATNNISVMAESGFGKSWYTQAWIEENLPDFDYALVLDFDDEYRGLVKAGLAAHWIAGPEERDQWTVDAWRRVLEKNRRLVVARLDDLSLEDWRQVCAAAIQAVRSLDGSALVAIDEAHFVAPQTGGYPDVIKGLATTGRGENAATLWVTQRPAEMDETVLGCCQGRVLGGFSSDQDLKKLRGITEYPVEVHDPRNTRVHGLPPELKPPDADAPPVRKFEDDDGDLVGSEWIYSDTSGNLRRIDTREVDMDSTHYGSAGQSLRIP